MTLKITLDQYKRLQRFWWAVGKFNQLLEETPDAPSESVGPVFQDLDDQQREKEEGGAA